MALNTKKFSPVGGQSARGSAPQVFSYVTTTDTLSQVSTAASYTPEDQANKATDFTTINDTLYPSVKAVNDQFTAAGIQIAATYQALADKDVINGYPGLTNYSINFKNSGGATTSFLYNDKYTYK